MHLVEVAHADLSEVTRVVLVHVGAVVVLATGETATTGVLAVLAYTTVTGRDVATVLARVGETGRHGWRCVSFVAGRLAKSEEMVAIGNIESSLWAEV